MKMIHNNACRRLLATSQDYNASDSTPPPSLSGNLRSIHDRKEGTSSAILLGSDEFVMNRGIFPGCQPPT